MSQENARESLSPSELDFISRAKNYLENPNLLIRIANAAGKPIDHGLKMLPQKFQEKIQGAVKTSLQRGLTLVTKSVQDVSMDITENFDVANLASKKKGLLHSAASFGTGAIGGFFGMATLPIELPVTTAIMLRSIVSTAKDFGHDVSQPDVQLECLYVLSLGSSKTDQDDALDSAYWASRLAFTDLIRHASKEIEKTSAPLIIRFLAQIASRFEIVVSEKAMAELVPVIGAIGGGVINTAFTNHFNEAARFHFGLRALEKKHGVEQVQSAYALG